MARLGEKSRSLRRVFRHRPRHRGTLRRRRRPVLIADIQDAAAKPSPAARWQRAYHHCDVTQEATSPRRWTPPPRPSAPDIVFNNAGAAGSRLPIEERTGEAWDGTQALLLRSVALASATRCRTCARAARRHHQHRVDRRIGAGWSPIAYAVAKPGDPVDPRRAAELARTGCASMRSAPATSSPIFQCRHRQPAGRRRTHRRRAARVSLPCSRCPPPVRRATSPMPACSWRARKRHSSTAPIWWWMAA